MGIPHLTRQLKPYAEVVWFGSPNTGQNETKQVTSVVIDGPALVYHVYFCLLSRMEEWLNPIDAQPSSNEVSIGVMTFLLHLRDIGVTVCVSTLNDYACYLMLSKRFYAEKRFISMGHYPYRSMKHDSTDWILLDENLKLFVL